MKNHPNRARTHGDIQVFLCHFAYFADLEDFNWPALEEGAVCSRPLYGMHCRVDRELEFCPSRLRIAQELMNLLRFFMPDLLIFRISTDQRFRKEQSVQDPCMGYILVENEHLNSVETYLDLHKNS